MKKLLFITLAAVLLLTPFTGIAQAAPATPERTVDPNAMVKTTPEPTPTPTRWPNVVFYCWTSTVIEADTENVEVYFPNPKKNDGYYYIAFDLWAALTEEDIEKDTVTRLVTEKDEETQEEKEVLYALIYSSGLVPAGYCLQEIELVQPVPEGSYKAFVSMQPYYADSFSATPNNASLPITLNAVKPVEEPEREEGFSVDGRVVVTPKP